MNEWISVINYASAFESAGIPLRPPGMSSIDVELTGFAAATSHLWGSQSSDPLHARVMIVDKSSDGRHSSIRTKGSSDGSGVHGDSNPETNFPVAREIQGTLQFKETFNAVKTELAGTHTNASNSSRNSNDRSAATCDAEVHPVPVENGESSHLGSRARMIHCRVQELETQIRSMDTEIGSYSRFSRNIAVLVPFQKSTRGRLQEAIRNMAKRVQASRLHVTKLNCYRVVLLNDLEAETEGFKRATSLALQTATETLKHHMFKAISTTRTLSTLNLRGEQSPPEDVVRTASQSSGSLTGASFRTALDFGPDWPSSGEAFASSTLRETARVTDPSLEAYENSGGFPSPNEHSRISESSGNPSVQDMPTPDKSFGTPDAPEEQAEEWSKTRAAKRVSLVRLPSDLQLSTVIGRSSQYLHLGPNTILVEEPSIVSRSSS